MRVRLNVTLLTCKRCQQEHNNPFTHTCRVGMNELGVPAGMRKARDKKRAAAQRRNGR
ncbi:hypothetical protein ACIBEJ_35275 [Nonomuraea sp. NPDC050790]|uniref:hypothetical protein n=1 Tax=Nonomuraea sp. NPDC050790 TaxID=3364371 RepID=UPI0037B411E0